MLSISLIILPTMSPMLLSTISNVLLQCITYFYATAFNLNIIENREHPATKTSQSFSNDSGNFPSAWASKNSILRQRLWAKIWLVGIKVIWINVNIIQRTVKILKFRSMLPSTLVFIDIVNKSSHLLQGIIVVIMCLNIRSHLYYSQTNLMDSIINISIIKC